MSLKMRMNNMLLKKMKFWDMMKSNMKIKMLLWLPKDSALTTIIRTPKMFLQTLDQLRISTNLNLPKAHPDQEEILDIKKLIKIMSFNLYNNQKHQNRALFRRMIVQEKLVQTLYKKKLKILAQRKLWKVLLIANWTPKEPINHKRKWRFSKIRVKKCFQVKNNSPQKSSYKFILIMKMMFSQPYSHKSRLLPKTRSNLLLKNKVRQKNQKKS